MTPVSPDPLRAGQESVWSYPRPAIAEHTPRRIRIEHRARVIADTRSAVRTLETSHPPSYYISRDDIDMSLLRRSAHSSFCEWKGGASYFDVIIEGEVLSDVAWTYLKPSTEFEIIRDKIAFYPAPFNGCFVDGERVIPQQGGFYGGWITSHVAGPFKGIPGSRFW